MRWIPIAFLALLAGPPPAAPAPEAITANDNRRPAGRLEHGVLTLALEVRPGLLRPEEDDGPGIPALAFAEVGQPLQVPGPLIRVPQGTEVRVSLRNPTDSTLVVHGFGGRAIPSAQRRRGAGAHRRTERGERCLRKPCGHPPTAGPSGGGSFRAPLLRPRRSVRPAEPRSPRWRAALRGLA